MTRKRQVKSHGEMLTVTIRRQNGKDSTLSVALSPEEAWQARRDLGMKNSENFKRKGMVRFYLADARKVASA